MIEHLIHAPCAEVRALKLLSIRVAAMALCTALAACGGDDARTNIPENSQASAGGASSAPIGSAGASSSPPATAQGSAAPVIESGIRPDVQSYLSTLNLVDDERRAITYLIARSMQSILTAPFTLGPGLHSLVNDMYRARVCAATLLNDGKSLWVEIENRTFNTLERRARYWQFGVARQLLARSPDPVVCRASPPRGGGDSGLPPAPPPAPASSPTTGQMLKDEFARLESRGDLPILDRSADVRGPDLNGNGVRDDIDTFIAAQTLVDPQRRAMAQVARSLQRTLLVKLDSEAAVQAVSEANIAAAACLARVFEGNAEDRTDEYLLKIEAITANTPERAKRYMQYMRALSGTSVSWPRGDTCEPRSPGVLP